MLDKYVTDTFLVETGVSETNPDQTIYKIINKDTKVVEYEDHILARTIQTLIRLEDHLKEANLEFDTGKLKEEFVDGPVAEGIH